MLPPLLGGRKQFMQLKHWVMRRSDWFHYSDAHECDQIIYTKP